MRTKRIALRFFNLLIWIYETEEDAINKMLDLLVKHQEGAIDWPVIGLSKEARRRPEHLFSFEVFDIRDI